MNHLLTQLRQIVDKRLAWDSAVSLAPVSTPAVFILTPPRSGSTLLRVMLAGHPKLFAPPELELLSFSNLKHRQEALAVRHDHMLKGLLRAVMELRRCTEAEAEALIAEWEAQAVPTQAVYAQLQQWCGSRTLIDKSVHYALSPTILQRAEAYFEKARYIHLTRHPQATLRSIVSMKMEEELFGGVTGLTPLELAEGAWTLSHQNILGFLEHVPANRQHRVRFEDLVSEPRAELERICDFLQIDFHADLLSPYQEKQQRMSDGMGPQDPNFHRHTDIDAKLATAWKQEGGNISLMPETGGLATNFRYWDVGREPYLPAKLLQISNLSSQQLALWLSQQRDSRLLVMREYLCPLPDSLKPEVFVKAFVELAEAVPLLRQTLVYAQGAPQWQTSDNVELPIIELESTEAQTWMAQRPLAEKMTALFSLLHLADGRWEWGLRVPTVMLDNAGIQALVQQTLARYRQHLEGAVPPLLSSIDMESPQIQHRDYLQSDQYAKDKAKWLEYPASALTTWYGRYRRPDATDIRHYHLELPAADLYPLADNNSDLRQALATALVIYLRTVCQAPVITLGVLVTEHVANIGRHSTVIPLGLEWCGNDTVAQLQRRVQEQIQERIPHAKRLPLVETPMNPLFNVLLEVEEANSEDGLDIIPSQVTQSSCVITLWCRYNVKKQALDCHVHLNAELFSPDLAPHALVHLTQAITCLDNPQQLLDEVMLFSEKEQQLLQSFNQTATDYPEDQTIVGQFEKQVMKTPNNIAVVFEDQQLTYQQLNERANKLAHHLLTITDQTALVDNPLLAIAVERSLDTVVGFLGVLKAGCAYVPIDPSYPTARIQYLLEDSRAPLLLTQSHLKTRFSPLAHDCTVIYLDEKEFADLPNTNPDIKRNVADLAYVIYTSGSTGMPKGVMVEHQALTLHCQAILQQYSIDENDKVLQFASTSFDASLEQFLIAWLSGASSILVKNNILTASDLLAFLHYHAITVADIPPAYWLQILETKNLELPHLRILILGGEALPVTTAQQTVEHFPTLTCFNAYGPTEAVITPTVYQVPARLINVSSISIGQPRANTRVYILNAQHQPQPLSVPGELCIASAGLARGYLNRPELTAEKFIAIKIFGEVERIYKTGDLARWLPDGNLEYLGRIDDQVKLRGFRVELGEIEAVLTQHQAVKEAAVILYEDTDDNKRLIAYVTEDGNQEDIITELRTWLKDRLPDYMVPAQFMILGQLPLMPSGKVDRKALPTPEKESRVSDKPLTPTEELLASLWGGVLKVETINRHDNFFELGGHSLLATQLVARIRDSFQVELPVQQLFQSPVLSDLAVWIEQQQGGEVLPPIKPQPEGAAKVMSYEQQAFWLRSQLDQQASVHNMRHAVWVRGPFNVPAMRQALQQLMERQACLRFYFPDMETVAFCSAQDVLEFSDLSHMSEAEQTVQLRKIIQQQTGTLFDLRQGPLIRIHLAQLSQETHVLLLSQHHMLGDAWSLAIWEREWQAFYHAQCQSTTPKLPSLPIQYTDYAAWQREYLTAERLAKLENYWLALLQDAPELLQLPTDFPRPMQQQGYGRTYEMNITPKLHQTLRQVAPQHNSTLFMLLFSAFNLLLYRFSGQTDLCVGVPMVNRHHAETQTLIGIFLNILPMRTRLDGTESFIRLLEQVRHHSLEAQSHVSLPFANLLPKLKPTQQQGYNPYFQVMFNWATAPDEAQEASELRLEPYRDPLSEHERAISNLDIVVALMPSANGGVNIRWIYDTALFKAETIELLANSYQYLLEQVVEQPEKPIRQFTLAGNAQMLYPLTLPQRAIWLDQMVHDGTPLYNIGGQVRLPGALNVECFRQAVNLLLQKHDNLRLQLTKNRDENGIPQQTIVLPFNSDVALHDFRAEANPQQAAQHWMQQRFAEPFALEGAPLFRYDLIQVADEEYYWLAQYHHLMIDGYGMAILNRSLADIYTQLSADKEPILDSPSYANFIDDDRLYIESPVFEKQRQYWLDKFSPPPEPLLSQVSRSQHAGKLVGSECEAMYLSRDFYTRLNRLAMRNRTTLFSVLLGVLYVYFTRTAQRDDFVIGLPMLNRAGFQSKKTEQLTQISGLFASVSPVWLNFGKALTFTELLQQITQALKANYTHQRFPVNEINRVASVGSGSGRVQLFDVMMSFEQHDYDACFDGIHSRTDLYLHPWEQAPLTIFVRDFHADADVKFDFVFNLAYFNRDDIKALQARFVTILESILENSAVPITALPVMTVEESTQLLAWTDTATDYQSDKTIVDLFEQQAEKTPDSVAVIFEQQQLTYRQLNEKANQLAHYLLDLKKQNEIPDCPLIAMTVERSVEMVIGLLGILKAGSAYVPIDPSYPTARIQYMLEDTVTSILLTQSHLQAQLPALKHTCVRVCLDKGELFANQMIENPTVKRLAIDLAYAIYTSGSTGMPKGVCVPHHAVVRLVKNTNYAQLDSEQVFLQYAPVSFDAATLEIWGALLHSAKLVLMPSQQKSIEELAVILERENITVLWLTSSLFNLMLETHPDSLRQVKQVLTGGEALSVSHILKALRLLPDTQLINGYGPTENTTFTCCYRILDQHYNDSIPIGKPIANTRVFVVDKQHQPVPIGIVGELVTSGAGLAHGYLNRPKLTAEKFIEVRIFGKTERIYKTGDLVRWLPDGNLEYLGRIDHQVKLRGFRIELGEIEAVLSQHEIVNEAVAILYEQEGNKSLVAYLTMEGKGALPATDVASVVAELREWLKDRLPDYMIPASFTLLERWPLSPSGKIDRKALPAPVLAQSNADYEPPSNETEQNIAKVWQQALNLENPSIHASFFELGGHSLLAIQIHSLLQIDYPKLNVVDLFTYPTIHALANHLNQNHEREAPQDNQQLHQQRGEKRRAQRQQRTTRQRKQQKAG